jgi:transcriptional regulator with XRE-family HTH domain
MSNFGSRLREERKKTGLNQEDYGSIGGVKKGAQLNYETGERYPDAAYLEKIAAAGADVQYIVTGVRSVNLPASGTAEPGAKYCATPQHHAVLQLYDALDEGQRREILHALAEKKRLNELEALLREQKRANSNG